MISRMIRAAFLDSHLYEEVERDSKAIWQAIMIVVLVSIVRGISTLTESDNVVSGITIGLVGGLISWSIWAFITYIVGVKLLSTETTSSSWGELARVTGFAQTPGLLFILVLIPVVGKFIALPVLIWQLFAMVVGIRQALDYNSTFRAVFVVLIGFVVVVIIQYILFALTGGV